MGLSEDELLKIRKLKKKVKNEKYQMYFALVLWLGAFGGLAIKPYLFAGLMAGLLGVVLSLLANRPSQDLLELLILYAEKTPNNIGKISS